MTLGTIDKGRDAIPPVLDSSLLALRDRARRNRFTSEWRRAMRPSGAAEVTVLRKR